MVCVSLNPQLLDRRVDVEQSIELVRQHLHFDRSIKVVRVEGRGCSCVLAQRCGVAPPPAPQGEHEGRWGLHGDTVPDEC